MKCARHILRTPRTPPLMACTNHLTACAFLHEVRGDVFPARGATRRIPRACAVRCSATPFSRHGIRRDPLPHGQGAGQRVSCARGAENRVPRGAPAWEDAFLPFEGQDDAFPAPEVWGKAFSSHEDCCESFPAPEGTWRCLPAPETHVCPRSLPRRAGGAVSSGRHTPGGLGDGALLLNGAFGFLKITGGMAQAMVMADEQ